MSNAVLETTELTKVYRGRKAVDRLSLRVLDGDIYGFLGPNGAGKSTTIRMLTGLVHPNSGTARVMDFDIRSRRVQALRSVGALVEAPAMYKYLSARENLRILARLSGGCTEKRIDQVLDTVGLLDRANDKVKTFSHGMLQRLGIAQALLPNPKLVILDEPTNGLDPQGMRDIRELILRLAREEKVTVFLSSHLLHEVEQICSRVGIINRGRLVAEGDVDALLRSEVELVEFRVSDPQEAIGIIGGLEWAQVLSAEEGAESVAVRAPVQRFPDVNRALVSAGIDVYAMVPKALTLEGLFMKLVEDDGAD